MEAGKGNPFAVLMPESLEKLTKDMNLHVSGDNLESKQAIDKLIDKEKVCYEEFLENNPEVLLLANLDGQFGGTDFVSSQNSKKLDDNTVTPMHSLKEAGSSPP
jgi:hypothetical protein